MDHSIEWDAFISHATEDKASFVTELASELRKFGLQIWFDAFSLRIGDSLRESIDKGLANSRFGIVVLSPAFFAKQWPQKELNGLFARQVEGVKVILPIWHQINKAELLKYSPMIADMVAGNSNVGVPAIAKQLVEVIRPELLRVENIRERVEMSVDKLREHVRQHHRGLDCQITSGPTGGAVRLNANQLHLASVSGESMRIDLFSTDPEKYRERPLRVNLEMSKEAWRRITEANRTGDTVTIGADELFSVSSDIYDILGLFQESRPSALIVSTPIDLLSKRLRLRVSFRKDTRQIDYSFVEMKPTAVGSEQVHLESVSPLGAMHLGLVLPLERTGRKASMSVRLDWEGREVAKIAKVCEALSIMRDGGTMELFDLENDKVLGRLSGASAFDWIDDDGFREFVGCLCALSDAIGKSILWKGAPTGSDVCNAKWLNEVLNTGQLCVPVDEITLTLDDVRFEAAVQALNRGERLRLLSSTPPEFACVFGQVVDLGSFQLLVAASELADTSTVDSDGILMKEVRLKTQEPLRYIFDRFSHRIEVPFP